MAEGRPNILLIITHDTGRHLGCYGRPVETPHLDHLAEEGVQFAETYCTAPQCSPSRASLITGLTPHQHGLVGLINKGFQMTPSIPHLPALLAAGGYATHLFGIQHEARNADELGYQVVHEAASRSCKDVAPRVVDFLDSAPQQPFFASVGFFETHRKFPDSPGPWDDVKVPEFLPNVPEVRHDVGDLNLSVKHVDDAVGAILGALARSRFADNTLVVYTTDHGIAFPGAKATLFDPGIQISLLVRGPRGFRGGKRVGAMVRNLDLFPTFLDLAGVTAPPNEGHSLIPLVDGSNSDWSDRIFTEMNYHVSYDPARGVRTRRYKYIRSFEPRPWWVAPNIDGGPRMQGYTKNWFRVNDPEVFTRPRPAELLFDLAEDPLERRNLADDVALRDVLGQLRQNVADWMAATDDPLLNGVVPPQPGVDVTPPDHWEGAG